MTFDFDTAIDRRNSSSMKWDKYANKDILPMWVADMDFKTAPAIIDALHGQVEHGIFGYASPPQALTDVVISMLAERYQWHIEAEWIVWLPGVVPGLSAACRAVGNPGDQVMTNSPVYHHFLHVAQQAGKELIDIPLHEVDGRWTYNLEAIEAAITPTTKMIMLCSPHNPVGTCFTRDELKKLTDLCAARDIVICSDEVHCDLILDRDKKHTPTAMAAPEYAQRMITLMATSKTFNLAGANCSFAIIPDSELRNRYRASTHMVMQGVTTMAYTAALAAFRDSEDWQRALIDYLGSNRDLLEEEITNIPGLSMPHVEATYLAWIDTSELAIDDPGKLFEKYGVGLSGGAQFGNSNYVRINFGCPRATLEEAIRRIKKAVASL